MLRALHAALAVVTFGVALDAGLDVSATAASAQARATFSSARFQPAIGPGNYLSTLGASALPPPRDAYGVWFDYATDTLIAPRPCRSIADVRQCDARDLPFVAKTGLVHLLYARGLGHRAQFAIDLPVGGSDAVPLGYTINGPSNSNPYRSFKPRDGFVFGDLRLETKARLWASDDRRLRVGVAASATVPTSLLTSDAGVCKDKNGCSFLGERGAQVTALGIGEVAPRADLRVAVNAGVRYRPERNLLGAKVGSELLLAAAAQYTIVRGLDVTAEIDTGLVFSAPRATPLEARGGLTYGRDLRVTLAAGAGIVGDVGSARYRLLAGVAYSPVAHDRDGDRLADDRDQCPDVPEDRDGFEDGDGCPDPDDDGDHILDRDDRCPRAAEDVDGFQDDDGCPDPDNDGDGVPDGYDSCEGELEDHDGDHDDDGCPDGDRDRDGVDDARDRCPDVAEDIDGLADEDGCPEEDADGDGIADVVDACPEAPETKNRSKDGDGCPD